MAQSKKFIEVDKVDPKVAATEMAGLQDVLTPPPVSWRPQTIGWYVLGALIVAGAVWLMWHAWRQWQARRYRREAIAELNALAAALQDPPRRPAALRALADLVKRTQLSELPRRDVASLSGRAWREALSPSGRRDSLPDEPAGLLVQLSSARDEWLAGLSTRDTTSLVSAVRQWVLKHHAGAR
jgi:hypothetical protein